MIVDGYGEINDASGHACWFRSMSYLLLYDMFIPIFKMHIVSGHINSFVPSICGLGCKCIVETFLVQLYAQPNL